MPSWSWVCNSRSESPDPCLRARSTGPPVSNSPNETRSKDMKVTNLRTALVLAGITIGAVAFGATPASAHHPIVSASTIECLADGATTWPVNLTITSDAPGRGKEYTAVSPAGYAPAGWVSEATPLTRTVDVSVAQDSFTETVSVSWRLGDNYGPTGVAGTTTAYKPPTCPTPRTATASYNCAVRSTDPAQTAGTAVFTINEFGSSWSVAFNGGVFENAESNEISLPIVPALAAGSYPWSVYDGEKLVDSGTFTVTDDCIDEVVVYPSASVSAAGAADCSGQIAEYSGSVVGADWPEGSSISILDASGNVLKSGLNPGDTFTVTVMPAKWALSGTELGGEVSVSVTGPASCPNPVPAASVTSASCTTGGTVNLQNLGTGTASFIVTMSTGNASSEATHDVTSTKAIALGLNPGQSVVVTVKSGGQTLVNAVTVSRPTTESCTPPPPFVPPANEELPPTL